MITHHKIREQVLPVGEKDLIEGDAMAIQSFVISDLHIGCNEEITCFASFPDGCVFVGAKKGGTSMLQLRT